MRRRRAAVVLVALASSAGATASARAADRPLRDALSVEPGATCIERDALVDHIRTWLGADTVDAGVSVEVSGSPDHARVVSFRTVRAGRVIALRSFDPGPASCDDLRAALGLAIAMALKASLVDELAPERPEAVTGPPAPPATVSPAGVPAVTIQEVPAPAWGLGVEALTAFGVLPDPAFGLGLRVERDLSGSLGARLGIFGIAAWGERFDGADGHFDSLLVALRLDACDSRDLGRRLAARACIGLAGGGLHTQGYTFPSSRAALEAWLAVANGLDARLKIAPGWALDAGATLLLPLGKNSIVLVDSSGQPQKSRDLAAIGWVFGFGPVHPF